MTPRLRKKNHSSESLRHIAIIMDGNGRWAKKRNLPRTYGHRVGIRAMRRIMKAALEENIEFLTFYAFSTENWKRPPEEVKTLMNYLEQYLDKRKKNIPEYPRTKVLVIGRWRQLPGNLPQKIENIMQESMEHRGLNLVLALNYGGRAEILDAVQKLIAEQDTRQDSKLREDEFRQYLYAPELPDVDLMIRTAGEHRLSNFLLWQNSYAEFYFTKKLWPDFGKTELLKAISAYYRRKRKFGNI